LGVVSTFSDVPRELDVPGFVLAVVVVVVVVLEAELPVELLDDPQPAISASAPHVTAMAMPVFIGRRSFLDKFMQPDHRIWRRLGSRLGRPAAERLHWPIR
jgi:hypothetical protein